MSETSGGPWDLPPDGAEQPEPRGPHRVIGTPPPAQARILLDDGADGSAEVAVRELPAGPDDPKKAKGAERIVAVLFILSLLASIGFIAAYVALPVHSLDRVFRSNLALGLTMTIAFGTVAIGAVLWVKMIMPQVELVEARKPLASTPEARAAFAKTFTEGAEASGFAKRPLLRRTLIAASAGLALAPIVVLRDMGPLPGTSLRHTVWRKGTRLLVYGPNAPLRPADFAVPGQMITVVPDGYQDNQDALAKATTIIIKFAPGQLQPNTPQSYGTQMNWTVENIVAYSKICTHVGCPVALYEETTHNILCPCHQSTFDATRGAAVIFGPAARPLPQLPLGTDAEGYLIATHDYYEPVGPSFWERG
ncbi:MAG TPA: Rieske 2Fe-2S domain-containing protein [Streptosporangiaceae bacterium]|jgi:ubiquinol-cytochrome c reductase iron-sulfur subunit|nr:Rieske 2Fe-2S domain-containing protein [Streptosporangiaceae bacterium]